MTIKTIAGAAALAGLITASSSALALTVPFTETFEGGIANWRTSNLDVPVELITTGGADGGQYISATGNFTATSDQLIIFRCHDSRDCSGDAFVGDWLSSGVGTLSFSFRHDAAQPLQLFARIATPNNFPGLAVETSTAIAPGVWTHVILDLALDNPFLTVESFVDPKDPATYAQVLSNVGNFQIGLSGPVGFAGTGVRFDLDGVSISAVPLPAAAWLMLSAVGTVIGVGRRRSSSRN